MTTARSALLRQGWRTRAANRPPLRAFFFTGFLLLQGCAGGNTSRQALAEVDWRFAKDAVTLDILATPNLNLVNNEPHTLVLAVLQMRDVTVFRKLVADTDALGAVLEGGPPGDGFLEVTRYVVSPGTRATLSLDRAENARLVGVAAGYYEFDAANAARVFEVPVNMTRKGWFTHHYEAAPGPLVVRLGLGALSIMRAETDVGDAAKAGKDGETPQGNGNRHDTEPGSAAVTTLQQL